MKDKKLDFKKDVESYFTNRGYPSSLALINLTADIFFPIEIQRYYFAGCVYSEASKRVMVVGTGIDSLYKKWISIDKNKYCDWFIEHIRPYMKKYNIRRNEIKFV